MFKSMAIPGILSLPPSRKVSTTAWKRRPDVARHKERIHASMTIERTPSTGVQRTESVSQPAAADGGTISNVTQLYEQFRRPIHSYIYRLLGNSEDADDVTQEVFVRACTAWEGLYDYDHLSAWLYRIASNLSVDLLRRRKRISWRFLGNGNASDDHLEWGQREDASYLFPDAGGIPEIAERDQIRLALAAMPEEYAVALVLNVAQGIPYQEVATIVGISPNAAATRISRAKRMFVEQYERLNKDDAQRQERAL